MNAQKSNKKGFTIIEVVLVLAIAALIFLMVFLAFPALQRNQKDQQRRSDIGRFMSQLSQYQTNTNGNVPTSSSQLNSFASQYLRNGGDQFNDPDTGNAYNLVYGDPPASPAAGTVYYRNNAACNSSGTGFTGAAGARKAAALVKLQSSGVYCQNN